MNGEWNQEMVRLLTNWAMWLASGRRPASSPYPAYNLAPPGPRYGNIMPILSGEAEDVDHIMLTLPARFQQPLRMHYCWPMRSDRSKASSCKCCLNTYKHRLGEAHLLFSQAWYRRPSPAQFAA